MTDVNTVSPQPSPRVTFQRTPTSSPRNIISPSGGNDDTPELELSCEKLFESSMNQLFTKIFLAVMTSKGAVLKEVPVAVINSDENQFRSVWTSMQNQDACVSTTT